MLAVLLFSFAACDDLPGLLYEPVVYKSSGADGTKYELTITRPSKAVLTFTPAAGDSYTLAITTAGVTQTSSGKVKDFSGNKFTLTASNNVSVSFEVTVSGNAITNISGTITVEGGGTIIVSGTITPAGGFVAVTEITGVPSGALAGTPLTLSGTVAPNNATNKTIAWSVKDAGTTGAAVSGNTLTSTAAGSVTVTATIANGQTASTPYTQDFSIAITSTFVAVTEITGVPSGALVGTPLTLTGTVAPNNATNKTIAWSVKDAGTTGAAISGNTLTATAAGSVTVTATIANGKTASTPYTQDFTLTITNTFVAVTNISGVPTGGTAGSSITLSGTVAPDNATNKAIAWSVKNAGSTGAAISGNILSTTASGAVTVTATIANGQTANTPYTKDFTLTIASTFVAVTNVSGVPTSGTAGIPITLTGTVAPDNATNKTISWSVKNAGTTGANISGNTLTATAAGSVTVTATIVDGKTATTAYTQDFTITITGGGDNDPLYIITGSGTLNATAIRTENNSENRCINNYK